MLQVYNIKIHKRKDYIPFIVIVKYLLYSPCYTIYPCSLLYTNNLYLFIPYPPHCPSLLPPGHYQFVFYICELVFLLLL